MALLSWAEYGETPGADVASLHFKEDEVLSIHSLRGQEAHVSNRERHATNGLFVFARQIFMRVVD